MAKILVTGGSGVIGSFLVKRLLHDNSVVILDDLSSGQLSHIAEIKDDDNLEFIKGSVTDLDTLIESMRGVETVYHLAANGDVRYRPDKSTRMDFDINSTGTYNVLEAMRRLDVTRLTFSSTSSVYGLADVVPTPESYGPLLPESLYGGSKLAAEGMISSFASLYGIKSSIYRFANIVAPISRTIGKNVIPDFIDKLHVNNKNLLILGDGYQRKSYLYVDDCVDGMIYLSEKQQKIVDIFNLGTEDNISVNEIADIVIEEMHLESVTKEYTGGKVGWKGDVPLTFLDIKKGKSLGWEPGHNSSESVRLSARGLLAQGIA